MKPIVHLTPSQKLEASHKLADFLFPPNGEWEFYVSPTGYKFLKIRPKKEQAA